MNRATDIHMPSGRNPDVSVVVPTWNRREELLACLESLQTQTGVLIETIVVDDGSDDGTCRAVEARFSQVKLLGDSRRLGPEARRNQGILAASSPYVLFIDSDVVFQDPGLIRRTLDGITADATIGELGGEFPVHDREHANGHRFSRSWYPQRARIHRDRDEVIEVDYLPSCFLMCRRDVLLQVGGFDPYYLFGPTDADLGLRIGNLGLRNVAGVKYAVWHNASESGRRPDQVWCYCLGRVRLMLKQCGVARTMLQAAWDFMLLTRVWVKKISGKTMTDTENAGLIMIPRAYAWHLRHLRHTLSRRGRNFLLPEEVQAFETWRQSQRR